MKASHDSLTSYKLKSWWMKPFSFISKCQNKDIESQLNAGVQYFDLRFNLHDGKLYGQHGFLVYDITIDQVLQKINNWTFINKKDIYYRILLEDTMGSNITFNDFLIILNRKLRLYTNKYMHIHLVGSKSNWSKHTYYMNIPFYGNNNYENSKEGIKNKIFEMLNSKERDDLSVYECYTYKGIPWLFGLPYPKLASKKINKHIKEVKNFIMQDFI